MYKGIEGNKYGMLTAIRNTHKHYRNTKSLLWEFRCDCGNTKEIIVSKVVKGEIRSCGCLHKISPAKTHGESTSKLYGVWCTMKNRCYNPNVDMYHNYGARGITVCDEWLHSYVNFRDWAYSHGYKEHLSIDRIDNNLGYSPSNCRWIPLSEQARNKRNTIYLTYNGETKRVQEWAEIVGISAHTITARVKDYGYSVEDALTLPVTNPPTLPKHKILTEGK